MKTKRDIILENNPLPKKDPNWKPLNRKDHPYERDHCYKYIEIPKIDFNYSIDYTNKITSGFNAGKELYSIDGFDYTNKRFIDTIEKLDEGLVNTFGSSFPDEMMDALTKYYELGDMYKNSRDVEKSIKKHINRDVRAYKKRQEKKQKKKDMKKVKFHHIEKKIVFD